MIFGIESIERYGPVPMWHQVQGALENGDYRPTVIITCVREDMVQPGLLVANVVPDHGQHWGLPQGGIEPEDTGIRQAVRRELKEEIGLEGRSVMYSGITPKLIRSAKPNGHRGFSDGALYIPATAIAAKDALLVPNPTEVAEASWRPLTVTAEDIVAQHASDPNCRTARTIVGMSVSLTSLKPVMVGQGHTDRQVKSDIDTAQKILRSSRVLSRLAG